MNDEQAAMPRVERRPRVSWITDGFGQDLRHAIRLLPRNPGFAAVAIVSLALGIGANAAVFSLLNVGFRRAQITIASRLPTPEGDRKFDADRYYPALLERLAAVPGVSEVAVAK